MDSVNGKMVYGFGSHNSASDGMASKNVVLWAEGEKGKWLEVGRERTAELDPL